MSVIIRGMDVPKGCNDCQLGWCPIRLEHGNGRVAPDCPISEVPPHGDLIDRSWIERVLEENIMESTSTLTKAALKMMINLLDSTPAVVEGEWIREENW